jgi:hypothetical protein
LSKQASTILTIGHSNHPIGRFITRLADAGVTAVADVRSAPVSRFSPQFNKKALSASLGEHGIAYAFLGDELGGPAPKAGNVHGRCSRLRENGGNRIFPGWTQPAHRRGKAVSDRGDVF